MLSMLTEFPYNLLLAAEVMITLGLLKTAWTLLRYCGRSAACVARCCRTGRRSR